MKQPRLNLTHQPILLINMLGMREIMNWKQFKQEVDNQMEQKGITQETEIIFIDTIEPSKVKVSVRKTGIFIES